MKGNTINKQEIEKFSKIADEWWNPQGKYRPLHKFNPARIQYIKENIIEHFKVNNKSSPCKNLDILDIGCGGGLLCEPLSRLGANVTGIDASKKNINVAKIHSKKNKLKINLNKKFDVILNMEIVEHVDDLNFFLKKSTQLLKKNGLMFVATLNKTLKSYFFAIIGAEYVLRWLPVGTHEWEKFIEPKKLIEYGEKNSLKINEVKGLQFNILTNDWIITEDLSVNYIAKFKKI